MQTEDPTFLAKAFDYAWVVVGALVGTAWTMLQRQITTTKEHQDTMIRANTSEIDRQRDNIAKLFDKLQAFSERAEARHLELLNAMHTGLNQKADK